MKFKKNSKILITAVAVLALLIGCAGGPSDEELSQLRELRQSAEAAEERVAELQERKEQLQKEIEEKKQELEMARAEKQRVENAIQNAQ